LDRFGGGSEGEWVVGALRFPDTSDARRASKAHVLLCAATLLVGELCPLFLSLPARTAPAATAADGIAMVAGGGSLAGGGVLVEDVAGGADGGGVGLGVSVGGVAAVGALTSLAAAALRKYLGRQLEVASPWVPLKVAGAAAVRFQPISAVFWERFGRI